MKHLLIILLIISTQARAQNWPDQNNPPDSVTVIIDKFKYDSIQRIKGVLTYYRAQNIFITPAYKQRSSIWGVKRTYDTKTHPPTLRIEALYAWREWVYQLPDGSIIGIRNERNMYSGKLLRTTGVLKDKKGEHEVDIISFKPDSSQH